MVGITWIGTSIFFMWLDRSIEYNAESKREGHLGELWMVHGGGFYHVEKMLMGPTKVPEQLHWFKWESYWTWMSGIFLLAAIFYAGNGTFLLDSTVSNVSFTQALGLSIISVAGSWFFYDFLWESSLTKKSPVTGHVLTLLWFGGMTYFLCHTLSGRAAYMHIGAMVGTWMTANVFLRIIPRQVKMVEASKRGEAVNQDWAKNAKNRSTHNTYFTLPVIFIMLSNHFPSTYGNKYNWLILIAISAAGAAIREFFVVRLKNPGRAKTFAAIGAALILAVMIFTRENMGSNAPATGEAEVQAVAQTSAAVVPAGPVGTIKGIVKYTGGAIHGEAIQVPLPCNPAKGEVYANDILVKDGRVQNALARITAGLKDKYTDVPTTPVTLDQKNCQYEPRVIGVRVGQRVDIVNSDPLFHNVRSFTKNNEEFNLAMPSQNEHIMRVFSKPEIFVQTKCSVHPWMSASIAVMDHPFFNVTGADGTFTIPNVPVGEYTLEIWHEVFGSQTKKITVKENQAVDLEFTMQGK